MCCVPSLWIILFGLVGMVQSKWVAFHPQNQTEHPWLRRPGESVRRELLGAAYTDWDDNWSRTQPKLPPQKPDLSLPSTERLSDIAFANTATSLMVLFIFMTLTIRYTCRSVHSPSYEESLDEETASLAHVA